MSSDLFNNLTLGPQQVAEEGEKIYTEQLKTKLEREHIGKFVAIDVVSGEYFLGDDILAALEKARNKYPDRVFHTIKIGSQGVFKLGSLYHK